VISRFPRRSRQEIEQADFLNCRDTIGEEKDTN